MLAIRVDDTGDTLFVAANEADRLITEELLPADAQRIVRVPWQTPPAEAALTAGAGTPELAVADGLRAARSSLLPAERDRYRSLCREVAELLTDVLWSVQPCDTERSVSASVTAALVARGIDPLVILVAGAYRLLFRHPLPTDALLGERAMIVVCGRRHGLIANTTRWVGQDDESHGILGVERAFLDASVPGRRLDEAFAAGAAAYGRNGFAADEWKSHHQGGPTGYAGRDPRATAATTDSVSEWQAFAWNPTAPGTKIEDTLLRTPDGWEVLTFDERWPTTDFGGLPRPVSLPYRR